MTNMMKESQIAMLSAEGRVQNGYESMYYRVNSGDPEVDAIIRKEMYDAFERNDTLLSDEPNEKQLREVMVGAYKRSATGLQKTELTPTQMQTIEDNFDNFTSNHKKFYPTTFDSFERLNNGIPVDFNADYSRMLRDNDGKDPRDALVTGDDLDLMEQEFNARETAQPKTSKLAGVKRAVDSGIQHAGKAFDPETKTHKVLRSGLSAAALVTPQGRAGKAVVAGAMIANNAIDPNSEINKAARSGLSYGAKVPEAKEKSESPRRSYQQVRAEEAAAEDMKDGNVDVKYDAYARNREDNHSKHTAGDDYGFDERDDDLEL